MSEIGQFLKSLREKKKYSLREAAERSGLSHSYIRFLEEGKRPGTNTPITPSPETLKALSKAYDFPYEELLKVAGIIEENEKTDHEDMAGDDYIMEQKRKTIELIKQAPEEDIRIIYEVIKKITQANSKSD